MRRCGIGAVHYLERVAARSCRRLGKQNDIAELQAGDAQLAVRRCHVFARKLSVRLCHLVILFGADALLHPVFVFVFRNQLRMSFAHKPVGSSFGVGAEHGAALLDEPSEGFAALRHPVYPVSFLAQAHQ